MKSLTKEQKNLHPSNPAIKSKTFEALEKLEGVDKDSISTFINSISANDTIAISASANLIFAGVYGTITVTPLSEFKNWIFDNTFWGIGAVGGASIGFIYTAYENFEDLFTETVAFHVQSFADGGGILQVNFFNSDALPIGQYNGALAGAGAVEGAAKGKWTKR